MIKAFGEDAAGNLLLGGDFTTIAGQTKNRLVRLDSTGAYDSSFDVGAGFNSSVNDIAISSSGGIWIGGAFTSYNNTTIGNLVLLKGDAAAPPSDPFASFVAGLPENLRGENDDADGDGIVNLIEFLFGTDPGNASAAPAPMPGGTPATGTDLNAGYGLSLDNAKTYRLVEIDMPADLQGLDVVLEASQDLSFGGDATATEVGAPTLNGGTQTRRFVITPAIEDAPAVFWRLKVSR